MRAISFYFTLYRTAALSRTEYRADFVIGLVATVMLQLAALSFYWIVFSRTETLGGWPAHAVLLLFGMIAMVLSLSEILMNGIWHLPFYVAGGEFDRILLYPVRSLPFLLISRPELHSIGNFLTGVVITGVSFHMAAPPPVAYALLPLWVMCGSIVYTSVLVLLGVLTIALVGPWSSHYFFAFQLLNASRYPVHIYPRWLKYILLFGCPVAVPIFLPARFILGEIGLFPAIAWPVIAAAGALAVAATLWERSLSRYQSTGS